MSDTATRWILADPSPMSRETWYLVEVQGNQATRLGMIWQTCGVWAWRLHSSDAEGIRFSRAQAMQAVRAALGAGVRNANH